MSNTDWIPFEFDALDHMPVTPGIIYVLIKHTESGRLYRFSRTRIDKLPSGYEFVERMPEGPPWGGMSVYDESGSLRPHFWALQRLVPEE